jgi:hypothetical protein
MRASRVESARVQANSVCPTPGSPSSEAEAPADEPAARERPSTPFERDVAKRYAPFLEPPAAERIAIYRAAKNVMAWPRSMIHGDAAVHPAIDSAHHEPQCVCGRGI